MMENKEIQEKLKKLIIDVLNLEDIFANDIDDEAPLFGEGLGLDSIDALELGLAIKENFHISLDREDNIKNHFYSVNSLAKHIQTQQIATRDS